LWPTLRRAYGWLAAVVGFLYWYSFVTCVETGMVNSLEVYRYLTVQLVFVIFAQGLTFLLILELLAAVFRHRRSAQTVRATHPNRGAG
jgi:hypothetical protein